MVKTGNKNKNLVIRKRLEQEIRTGRYAYGQQLPTDFEFAAEFGVSRPTVAKALGSLRDAGMVERRVGSGTFVTWRGGGEGARTLGLIVPGLGETEIFEPICAGISELAGDYDCNLMWGGLSRVGEDKPRRARELAERYVEQGVDGVFLAPLELVPGFEEINHDITARLVEAGIRVVLLDADIDTFPDRSDFDLVGLDNFAAGFVIAHHLMEHGCRQIGFLARPRSASTVEQRLQGYRAAHIQANVKPGDRLVFTGDPEDAQFVRAMLDDGKPDAVICANDATAAALIKRLGSLKVGVPGALKVAGIDDVGYASLLSPSLTTMRQPCREIAEVALNTMKTRLGHPGLPPRTIMLRGELVVRESTDA